MPHPVDWVQANFCIVCDWCTPDSRNILEYKQSRSQHCCTPTTVKMVCNCLLFFCFVVLLCMSQNIQTYTIYEICMCRRAFFVAGPSAWNSLPDIFYEQINDDDDDVSRDIFRKLLKTHLFALYWSIQQIRGFTRMSYTNLYLLI